MYRVWAWHSRKGVGLVSEVSIRTGAVISCLRVVGYYRTLAACSFPPSAGLVNSEERENPG